MSESLFPLRSRLRTREQMEWIHDRYKVDALERLARSTPDYYKTHGDYLPDVSALAHAAIEEAGRLRDWIGRHAGHPYDCAIWVELDDVAATLHPVGTCDCGLAEILGHRVDRMVMP